MTRSVSENVVAPMARGTEQRDTYLKGLIDSDG